MLPRDAGRSMRLAHLDHEDRGNDGAEWLKFRRVRRSTGAPTRRGRFRAVSERQDEKISGLRRKRLAQRGWQANDRCGHFRLWRGNEIACRSIIADAGYDQGNAACIDWPLACRRVACPSGRAMRRGATTSTAGRVRCSATAGTPLAGLPATTRRATRRPGRNHAVACSRPATFAVSNRRAHRQRCRAESRGNERQQRKSGRGGMPGRYAITPTQQQGAAPPATQCVTS